MIFQVRWKVDVFAKERKTGKRELIHSQDEVGNSIISNFVSYLFLHLNIAAFPAVSTTWRTTGNFFTGVSSNQGIFGQLDSGATDDTCGVILGSGATPVIISDYDLAAKIVHGSGAGQLLYGLTFQSTNVLTGNPRVMQVVRAFSNGVAGPVVVNEMGLVVHMGAISQNLLIERSVVSPFNIPALGSVTATSTIGVSI